MEVPDKDSTQVGPVVDLVAWQMLRPHGVTEVELQVLYDEEVISHSSRVACEPIILEPHTGVSVPVVLGYDGRSLET
jgi:hypothetical protein